jgi:hypothetical protein
MGAGDTFKFFQYTSDNGSEYSLKLSVDVANQGGFTTQVSPSAAVPFPFGPKNVRHVWGVTSSGKRTRLPIATSDFGLYVSGGSFTLAAGTYAVEGQIGEKRKYNSVA